ncbi:MAG: VOC family protein [Thermoproteota archaeon]|nr:VOC family protein [Thermoproteota archaeon]
MIIKDINDNDLKEVYRISVVTLLIKNMKTSCRFYSQIPGFKLVYGGSSNDTFATFEIGKHIPKDYLNLELYDTMTNNYPRKHFGRIVFHTEDVDKLYLYIKSNSNVSNIISFEDEPRDASWGERYFHIREPDGYQLSFAMPIKSKT